MPTVTPEAEKRRASRDRGTFGDGPFNTFEDFTLYDRCITRGIVGSVLRVIYGNGNRIVQAPGMVAHQLRDDPRHARHLHRRPAAPSASDPPVSRRLARRAGRATSCVVETTNLTDKTSIGGNGNGLRHSDQDEDHRALQARGRRRHPVPVHGRRSRHLRSAVHDVDAADAARAAACCCPTSATRATARCRTRSAPNAPRTRRSPPTSPRASSGRAGRCRKARRPAAACASAAAAGRRELSRGCASAWAEA